MLIPIQKPLDRVGMSGSGGRPNRLVGFLGAFTTFSAFGYETISLLRGGEVQPLGGEGTFLGFPDLEELYLSEEELDLQPGGSGHSAALDDLHVLQPRTIEFGFDDKSKRYGIVSSLTSSTITLDEASSHDVMAIASTMDEGPVTVSPPAKTDGVDVWRVSPFTWILPFVSRVSSGSKGRVPGRSPMDRTTRS